jgi:hypothetical protein
MTGKGIQNPLELPPDIANVVIPFIADVIDFADKTAPTKGAYGLSARCQDQRGLDGDTDSV